MPFVKATGLGWKYDKNAPPALNGIDFEIENKEFIGVMGPTGAGKTSLSLALRGLIPDFFEEGELRGAVVADGVEVTASSPQLFANVVGNVFQDASSQILSTTVYDDIAFGLCNLNLPREEVADRAKRYLRKFKLHGKAHRAPDTLSGGEMQRLVSAGVLCMEPKILVMDEPAAELDPRGRDDLCAVLDELRNGKDITVVLIEQDPELIARYASRVMFMDKGKIVSYDAPRTVFADIELCGRIGISPPEMADLAHLLRSVHGIDLIETPLTAEEMFSGLMRAMDLTTAIPAPPPDEHYRYEPRAGSGEPLYEMRDLVHVFRTDHGVVNALDGPSLNIYKGDYITLIGTNGAGKTTLTKHINNICSPASGRVRHKGRDIAGLDTADFLGDVGYCFQNPDHQIFCKTVAEEVAYGLVNMGLPPRTIEAKVAAMLELVDLADKRDENPFNLGKGERQKIALASTIILEPEFLVIDEPTTGLDWYESRKILELIEKLHRAGTTILVVTHDMRIVREYSTRVVAMHAGRIVYDGDAGGLLRHPRLFEEANISLPPLFRLYHMLRARFPAVSDAEVRTVGDMAALIGRLYAAANKNKEIA